MIVKSPAKINLFLYITGKRPDGYHELFSLMCTVGLFDLITFSFDYHKVYVDCNDPLVPENENNIAYKAAIIFFKELGEKKGVYISIDKNIPTGAGLGGGSSNAATVLKELNKYYGNPFSKNKLMTMGLPIGADVPFFIFNAPSLVSGIGEECNLFNGKLPCYVLLIYPGIEISTKTIFEKFNLKLTNPKKKNIIALLNDSKDSLESIFINDLEDVCIKMYPEVKRAKTLLKEYGAYKTVMTGSGSTIYGLFDSKEKIYEAKENILINFKECKNKNKWKAFACSINPNLC